MFGHKRTISSLTIDYTDLYILPRGRIYERVQVGSMELGGHVRHGHPEPESCKGLLAKRAFGKRVRATATQVRPHARFASELRSVPDQAGVKEPVRKST